MRLHPLRPRRGGPRSARCSGPQTERRKWDSNPAQQVLVTNGGKQAIYNLFQVLLNPGDEVLVPAPYWLSYPEMAALAGASTRIIPTKAEEGFRLDLALLEQQITPRSRLLVINSPGNPSGQVMARAEICLLYTSPSPRDQRGSRMPSSA